MVFNNILGRLTIRAEARDRFGSTGVALAEISLAHPATAPSDDALLQALDSASDGTDSMGTLGVES